MSTTSASSLFFHTLYPKTLASLSDPTKPALLSFASSSFSPLKSIPTFSRSFTHLKSQFSSRLIRNVAVSSEYGQEDGVWSGEEERDFSPDLKLFVGNLPFSVDSAQLAGVFENAGHVEMVEVIYDKVTGRSRGFGFVTMSTAEEAEAAAQQLNGYELEGRALRVNYGPPPQRESFSPRGPRGGGAFDSGNRLFIGNLSWNVDNLALETLFSEQGKVVDARVVYDRETGRSRGFGFVTYNSSEEMDNAIEAFNGYELDGRSIRVAVADARPKRQF